MTLIIVDCEAWGMSPGKGMLTSFGAVERKTRASFHGVIYDVTPDPANPAKSLKPDVEKDLVEPSDEVFTRFGVWLSQFPKPVKFVSDNPAYDFQWINDGFDHALGYNPFGHSARRIGDFHAGLLSDFFASSREWKELRITPHDHNPVNDAMGNVEALDALMLMANMQKRVAAQQRMLLDAVAKFVAAYETVTSVGVNAGTFNRHMHEPAQMAYAALKAIQGAKATAPKPDEGSESTAGGHA